MEIRILSPLEKVMLDRAPSDTGAYAPEGFKNETISFQAAYREPDTGARYNTYCNINVESPIADRLRIRRVVNVPVAMPAYSDADDDFISKQPGLYPDMLQPLDECRPRALPGQWNSIWIDAEGAQPGKYPVTITVSLDNGSSASASTEITILNAELPEQELIYTRWFHYDAIAQYYHIEMFGDRYWEYLKKFISTAVKRGINTILTPIHTPPLDTAVSGERMTAQLVDITLIDGQYRFGFGKLERFVKICEAIGVKRYEMAHLFTQWGAKHAPKIIVSDAQGNRQKLFGWHTDACSSEYSGFLAAYLTALKSKLKELGVLQRTIWHISDEPSFDNMESYTAARALVLPYIGDQYIIDALSDVRFYKTGAVEHPVPSNNHIHDFIDAKVDGLWTYYCCGQYKKVSNQFIAMPSYRERIIGVQMYKYNIIGFLHWGYNFYNTQYSHYPLDPFGNTDGDGFVPGGDTFQVYPGPDGEPYESIRIMVFRQCIDDMRALKALEALSSREHVLDLIERCAGMDITFDEYPRNPDFLIELRRRVNSEISKISKEQNGIK